jgi:hypothetical protein
MLIWVMRTIEGDLPQAIHIGAGAMTSAPA